MASSLILCLHGVCRSSASACAREFKHLLQTRPRVLVPDGYCQLPLEVVHELVPEPFRKVGQSYYSWFRADDQKPPEYRFLDDSISRALDLIAAENPQIIVGHSQGALFTAMLASRLPAGKHSVRGIVLINAPLMERFMLILKACNVIDIPCLYLQGTRDSYLPSSDEIRSKLGVMFSSFELATFKGSHFPPTATADWAAVDQFIDKCTQE